MSRASAVATLPPTWIGLLSLPMAEDIPRRLGIPQMVRRQRPRDGPAFAASIEARKGITTGISAADRAHTCRVAVDDATGLENLVMPGHVIPLRARPSGVLERPGQTEAAADLARLASLKPAGVIYENMKENGTMARVPDLQGVSEKHGIKMVTVEQIMEHRRTRGRQAMRSSWDPRFRRPMRT
jgi:3,4-dihydroxy 2-butanone 4-phosphate synthase/GTP cyclohydrolase II